MMADSNAGASRHTLGVNTAPRALSGFLHHRPIGRCITLLNTHAPRRVLIIVC